MALSSKFVCAAKLSPLVLASYDMAYVDIGCPAGWPRRALIVDAPHGSNESVSRLGNRLNVSVIARFLVEYLAKCRDIPVEVSLFNETVRPHELHQIVLRDDLTGPLQKSQKDSEYGRRDRSGLTALHEKELTGVYAEIVKFVNDSLCHAALIGSSFARHGWSDLSLETKDLPLFLSALGNGVRRRVLFSRIVRSRKR